MNLKELRIGFFDGIASIEIRFENGRPVTGGGLGGRIFSGDGSGAQIAQVFDALRWVLLGRTTGKAGEDAAGPRAVQLDFDAFSVHRNETGAGTMLRFFQYDPNPFCCAVTVKELTKETAEETQKLINDAVGISESDFEKFLQTIQQ